MHSRKLLHGTHPGNKAYIALADGASPVIRCARTLSESFKGFPSKLNSSVVLTKADVCCREQIWDKHCIDPRPLNDVLKRVHCKQPILEDVFAELSQTCKVSVCDLKSDHLQCELDHSSSLLTTFTTPFGRYR